MRVASIKLHGCVDKAPPSDDASTLFIETVLSVWRDCLHKRFHKQ